MVSEVNIIHEFMAMILSTLPMATGRTVKESLGVVQGSCVQSKHVGHDIFAGLKTIVGGELGSYTDLLSEARKKAMDRMQKEAEELGADAILNIRITSSSVVAGASEILVYGTAVKFDV